MILTRVKQKERLADVDFLAFSRPLAIVDLAFETGRPTCHSADRFVSVYRRLFGEFYGNRRSYRCAAGCNRIFVDGARAFLSKAF